MAKSNAQPSQETGTESVSAQPIDKLWTISNVITLCRILLVPVFVIVLVCPWPEWMGLPNISMDMKRYIAAGIFIVISCTDWLDGYLARSRNEVTTFGKFMDPLADKILVAAALLVLIELGSLPSWVALIILAREFIVSGVRMIAASEGVVIAASYIGKFKTVFQMIAIVLFTIKDAHMIGDVSVAFSDGLWLFSWVVMIIALVLTVISMLDYIVKARFLLGFGKAKEATEDSKLQVHVADSGNGNSSQRIRLTNEDHAKAVIEAAVRNGVTLGTAESLTGGLIASTLTSVAGSSAVVKGGIVSYINQVKHELLNVDSAVLDTQGAVCEAVALQMACGARDALGCDIAVAVTGIAGPSGAEPGKPVGTVYLGFASDEVNYAERFEFKGNREEVRAQTVEAALTALLEGINKQIV